ncbi:MAG: M48 family metalloprotease [Candidatus Eremiobacteraeota bacterium]|nr:M48 family metalloprotease [Candidatus Eremiobacteraeota bacterium]
MKMFRRLLPLALILAFISASIPAPALALSTESEISMGESADMDIVQGTEVETDPLLNKWVKGISDRLFQQTARKDVPYNVKILNTSDVNAFSTMGGFMYINEGALDFAQSDDEVAGVLGHETGHIERRHAVTMQAKSQGISLLLGIVSLFSPFVYRFGQLMQAGIMAKLSRVDELQADQYAVLLMSRAGYDPEAMVSFMSHLGQLDKSRPDLLTKYLADHPEPAKRLGHIMGYEQLDPKKVSTQTLLVEGVHDFDEARYNVAAMKLNRVLKADPGNAQALLDLGQAQLALGQVGKSEQSLAEAAQKGNAQTRDLALARMTSLRAMEKHRVSLTHPNLQPLRAQISQAQSNLDNAAAEISNRRDAARDQLKNMGDRLQAVTYEIPDFSRMNIRQGTRLAAVVKNLESMARSIDSALDHNGVVIKDTGSLERNKEGGVLAEGAAILHELQAPLNQTPLTPDALALLPSYPRMISELNASNGDLLRGVDASRASLQMADLSLGDLDAFLKQLSRVNTDFMGDITVVDYNALVPLMQKASDSLAKSAIAASQAQQLFNMARSRQLETRVTMLGLGDSPQRYATLQNALNARVGMTGIDYAAMLHAGLTPGEVAAATIIAADTNTTPGAIIQEAAASGRTVTDIANRRGMHAEALEIFMGLVYLDYTDDPAKENSAPVQQGTNTNV